MTTATDPGIDLDALRTRAAGAPDAARLRLIGLRDVVAGPDALTALPARCR